MSRKRTIVVISENTTCIQCEPLRADNIVTKSVIFNNKLISGHSSDKMCWSAKADQYDETVSFVENPTMTNANVYII